MSTLGNIQEAIKQPDIFNMRLNYLMENSARDKLSVGETKQKISTI